MRFVSTRHNAPSATLSEALRNGAAPDGGLYVPETLPMGGFNRLDPDASLAQFAAALLQPFFAGDQLESALPAMCAEAFDFPVPLVKPDPSRPTLNALELFHGPTGAFKDFGARFLLGCLNRLSEDGPLTVLVATSGDTGGAVGCAAQGRSSLRAVILYPKSRVSPFQEQQLTCWGENVDAIEVEGDFDDCQRLVKAAFADAALTQAHRLTSANSINIGRLFAQLAYSAWAALQVETREGRTAGFIVPSGNLGHGFAVMLAKAIGAPIGPVILATNRNRTLKQWSETGRFEPRASVATIANAMDVGNPSNFERLAALPPAARQVSVELVRDDQIGARICSEYSDSGYVWCPHSATAVEAWSRLTDDERNGRPWIATATAHPYKFREVVEPLIGRTIEPETALAAIQDRPTRKIRIGANLGELGQALREGA